MRLCLKKSVEVHFVDHKLVSNPHEFIYLGKLVVLLVKWSREPMMKLLKMTQSKCCLFSFSVLNTQRCP